MHGLCVYADQSQRGPHRLGRQDKTRLNALASFHGLQRQKHLTPLIPTLCSHKNHLDSERFYLQRVELAENMEGGRREKSKAIRDRARRQCSQTFQCQQPNVLHICGSLSACPRCAFPIGDRPKLFIGRELSSSQLFKVLIFFFVSVNWLRCL